MIDPIWGSPSILSQQFCIVLSPCVARSLWGTLRLFGEIVGTANSSPAKSGWAGKAALQTPYRSAGPLLLRSWLVTSTYLSLKIANEIGLAILPALFGRIKNNHNLSTSIRHSNRIGTIKQPGKPRGSSPGYTRKSSKTVSVISISDICWAIYIHIYSSENLSIFPVQILSKPSQTLRLKRVTSVMSDVRPCREFIAHGLRKFMIWSCLRQLPRIPARRRCSVNIYCCKR